jgi:hypothetical protein
VRDTVRYEDVEITKEADCGSITRPSTVSGTRPMALDPDDSKI